MKKHEKQKYKRGTEVIETKSAHRLRITDHALRFEPDIQQQLPDLFGSFISYRLFAVP
jgi:hypothetical protein